MTPTSIFSLKKVQPRCIFCKKQSPVSKSIESYDWAGKGAGDEVEFVVQDRVGRVIPTEAKGDTRTLSSCPRI